MTQRILRLCNTNWEITKALLRICIYLLLRQLTKLDFLGAVHDLPNRLNAFLDAIIKVIEEFEVLLFLAGSDDSLGKINCAGAAFCPVISWDSVLCAGRNSLRADDF